MDKVKQNIILQQQLDKFNIEKSVVGTEAYYINQDIQKGVSQDEIIEKARSGVYKLTAENKKAGRVGQRYGESKKEDKQNDTTLRDLETKLNYAKDFSPHKVDYYEQLIKEHKEKSNPKESTDKKESKLEKDYVLARDLKEGKEYTWVMGAEYMKCQYVGEGEKPYTYKFKLGNSTHNLSMKDVKDYIKPLSFLND